MNTEELRERTEETLHFDAHEFDGLRDTLEREAEGFFARADQFIRENPLLCIGLAAAAGFGLTVALGCAHRKEAKSNPGSEQEIDSRRM
jgi:ElaB/YqjD/DUF883 family membrane-anchored ribosome-binding protein